MHSRSIVIRYFIVERALTVQDGIGLLHDRDVVALYGDPAWSAKMAPGTIAYEQTLTEVLPGVYAVDIKLLAGEKSFDPVNKNGSQRGWRPFVQMLPKRVKNVQIKRGQELSPVITDDFVLIPNPRACDPNQAYRVEFTATNDANRRP